MTKRLLIIPLMAAAALLGACDSHHSNDNNSTASSPVDFSSFVQALIATDTCQSKTPVDLTSLTFTFDPAQDQAQPVSVDSIPSGCVF